ncbi:MAG: CatA-like O-acetyltransferase [Psychrobium sp.]
MSDYRVIDLASWNRAEHFKFYQQATHPWFNIISEIDAAKLLDYCKANSKSFFHAYLYLTQIAINELEPFKIRIVGDEVRVYDTITVSCAILADDETMRFCGFPYAESFSEFDTQASIAQQAAKASPFIANQFVGQEKAQDEIHMSVIPWVSFTSFTNARNTEAVDSIPKVVYGKAKSTPDGLMMTLSVEVHHGVMDGLYVGRFFEKIQQLFNQPAQHLAN